MSSIAQPHPPMTAQFSRGLPSSGEFESNCTGDLPAKLMERILIRAGHAVSQLRIKVVGSNIKVRGRTRSYYGWQLVQAAWNEISADWAGFDFDCAMIVAYNDECPS